MERAKQLTWKDYLEAYVRVLGIFLPTRFVWRPFGGLIEVDRCRVDGWLVGQSQASIARHQGHFMEAPTRITLLEMLLVWCRVIR